VTALTLILVFAGTMLGVVLVAVLAWFIYTGYLTGVELRLARRKGVYRALVAELASRDWKKFALVGFREGVAPAHG
jgi:pheromone shutdown protein TraB